MKRIQVDYGAPERTTTDERRAAGPRAVDVNTDGTSVTVGLERAIECRTLIQETQAYKEVTVPEKRGAVGLLWLGAGAAIGATALAFAYGPDDAIEFSENGTKVGEASAGWLILPIALGIGGSAAYNSTRLGHPSHRESPPRTVSTSNWTHCGGEAFSGSFRATLHVGHDVDDITKSASVGQGAPWVFPVTELPSSYFAQPLWRLTITEMSGKKESAGTPRDLPVSGAADLALVKSRRAERMAAEEEAKRLIAEQKAAQAAQRAFEAALSRGTVEGWDGFLANYGGSSLAAQARQHRSEVVALRSRREADQQIAAKRAWAERNMGGCVVKETGETRSFVDALVGNAPSRAALVQNRNSYTVTVTGCTLYHRRDGDGNSWQCYSDDLCGGCQDTMTFGDTSNLDYSGSLIVTCE